MYTNDGFDSHWISKKSFFPHRSARRRLQIPSSVKMKGRRKRQKSCFWWESQPLKSSPTNECFPQDTHTHSQQTLGMDILALKHNYSYIWCHFNSQKNRLLLTLASKWIESRTERRIGWPRRRRIRGSCRPAVVDIPILCPTTWSTKFRAKVLHFGHRSKPFWKNGRYVNVYKERAPHQSVFALNSGFFGGGSGLKDTNKYIQSSGMMTMMLTGRAKCWIRSSKESEKKEFVIMLWKSFNCISQWPLNALWGQEVIEVSSATVKETLTCASAAGKIDLMINVSFSEINLKWTFIVCNYFWQKPYSINEK